MTLEHIILNEGTLLWKYHILCDLIHMKCVEKANVETVSGWEGCGAERKHWLTANG